MKNAPTSAAFRPTDLLPVDLVIDRRADGTILMRSRFELDSFEPCLPRVLAAQALALGDQPYLVQRSGPERAWAPKSYAQMKRDTDAIAQWLLDLKIPSGRSLLILSGNSIAHATVKFGAMTAGIPVCPVSANYAMIAGDFARLKHVVQLVKPAVVFAEDAGRVAKALREVDFGGAVILTATPAASPVPAVGLADVLKTPVSPAVAAKIAALKGDDHAVYMLTSGSTGPPKAVIQTFKMIATNIAQANQTIGDAAGWRGVTMDWLPWSHVSGAFAKMLSMAAGGTLYIDEGKPIPGMFEESIRNLREVAGAYYVNVPAGYAMLADALEQDAALRQTFFRDLRVLLYGGAGLPQSVHDRMQKMAIETVGYRIMLISAYGSTETTSGVLAIHFESDKVGIGLPMPGVRVKLVPVDSRLEIRIGGACITPGYLRDPDKTAQSLDDEGYFKLGDLVQFHDPDHPEKGLAFAGRVAEEFKLGTGTWISGGQVRTEGLKALAPWVSEMVICGDGHTYVAVLAWPNRAAVERDFGIPAQGPIDTARWAPVRAALAERLVAYNAANPTASMRIRRCLLLDEPPQSGAHELSDKGTVNRNAVLTRRAGDVRRLYADPPTDDVIVAR